MLLRITACILCFTLLIGVGLGKPLLSEKKICFAQECPENTVACERTSQVSKDKKYIESTINCLGNGGIILDTISTQVENPFGPLLHFQGYSYTGSFSAFVDEDSNTSLTPKNRDVEEVIPEIVEKKSDKKPFSEADDLNYVEPK